MKKFQPEKPKLEKEHYKLMRRLTADRTPAPTWGGALA